MKIQEVGDRVFTLHFDFYDQQIGVVLGGSDVMVIDTRSTPVQAREIVAGIRELTRDPVSIVVDTHWHYDHTFGNSVFRPASIWGHVRAAERLRRDGLATIAEIAAELPALAADVVDVQIDPPEHTFEDSATVAVGDRVVELSYHGRAHTDGDIAVVVPDANVLFGGDLIEEGSPPSFGDSFPIDWPGTVERLLPLATGAVVPGHGKVGDRAFLEAQITAFRGLAALARDVYTGNRTIDEAIAESPFGPRTPADAFERALRQLRGEQD
ncbi:MAG TPA: MBL fold metallo-hydrolase [Candidatus Limnocylindrales bacterium]|jgi:glyoxylase-like metal-dependent hydrolase (beta-lactamase superfamily II)